MIKEAIANIVEGGNLSEREMAAVMDEIMGGNSTPAQIASFLTALRLKGETVEEITGAARVMRQRPTRIDARSPVVVDTCGTGGDGRGTFNISTTSAFVVAAAGLTVAKHGNRAVSSGCGSADMLEALGVKIDAGAEIVEECVQQIGIGFLFAPRLHGAMKYALGPRREIGIRTIFNMLGPLTNPAGATSQLIGVYDPKLDRDVCRGLEKFRNQAGLYSPRVGRSRRSHRDRPNQGFPNSGTGRFTPPTSTPLIFSGKFTPWRSWQGGMPRQTPRSPRTFCWASKGQREKWFSSIPPWRLWPGKRPAASGKA